MSILLIDKKSDIRRETLYTSQIDLKKMLNIHLYFIKLLEVDSKQI